MAERAKEARSAAPRRKLGLVRHLQAGLKTVNEDGARKTERPSLRVTARGCAGDVNKFRKIAKGPYSDVQDGVRNCRAVSLDDTAMSDPYGLPPGCFGANVTWEGADGENSLSLRGGQRLWIGDEVVLEVTFANKPCYNLDPLFSRLKAAGKISAACPKITSPTKGPLEPRGGPGQRGWFARVVQEGEIRVGDEIFAEAPDGPPAKKQRKISSYF